MSTGNHFLTDYFPDSSEDIKKAAAIGTGKRIHRDFFQSLSFFYLADGPWLLRPCLNDQIQRQTQRLVILLE
jgi:hypothetical protein